MSRKMFALTVILETLGIMVVSAGLGAELAWGGQIYLVLITAGSVLIAAGGAVYAKFLRRK